MRRVGRSTRAARGSRGLVLPSWLVAVSAVLVVVALVGFAVSSDREPEVIAADGSADTDQSGTPGSGSSDGSGAQRRGGDADQPDADQPDADQPDGGNSSDKNDKAGSERPDGSANPDRSVKADEQESEPVERRTAYVEVYNNAGITGLADQTAATLQNAGWRVVATDNWYGDIPSNTVYHPAGMSDQAELLAADLGVDRVMSAVEPMSFDRLTLILTGAP